MRNLAIAVLFFATFPCTACDTQTSQKMCSSEARTAVQGALTDEFGALVNPESVTVRVATVTRALVQYSMGITSVGRGSSVVGLIKSA